MLLPKPVIERVSSTKRRSSNSKFRKALPKRRPALRLATFFHPGFAKRLCLEKNILRLLKKSTVGAFARQLEHSTETFVFPFCPDFQ
jgi:hypothetical protein